GESGHEMGMGVAQRRDGDAAGEIEIASPVRGEKVGTLAALEGDLGPLIGRHHRWNHCGLLSCNGNSAASRTGATQGRVSINPSLSRRSGTIGTNGDTVNGWPCRGGGVRSRAAKEAAIYHRKRDPAPAPPASRDSWPSARGCPRR